jgi:hypothetical protein
LWEMLAGRNLLRCQRFDDERDWATRENPPPPSKYSTHSTPSLDRVVLKAIACEVSERYDSAFQFRAALLRADPAAVKLDAPMVAGLMPTMLGDELDRRRASWPSEVAGELDVKPEVTTSQSWRLEDLTAENPILAAMSCEAIDSAIAVLDGEYVPPDLGPFDEHGVVDLRPADEDGEPTIALRNSEPSPTTTALAHVQADALALPPPSSTTEEPAAQSDAMMVLPAQVIDGNMLHVLPVLVPQSAVDTLKVGPVSARTPELLAAERGFSPATLGSVCLVCGVFLGILLSPSPQAETEAQPAPPQPSAATAASSGMHSPIAAPELEPELPAATGAGDRDCDTSGIVDNRVLAATRPNVGDRSSRSTRGARKEAKLYPSRRGSNRKQSGKSSWSNNAKGSYRKVSNRIRFTEE